MNFHPQLVWSLIGKDEKNEMCYAYFQMCPSCKRPILGYKSGSVSFDGEGVTLTKRF